MESWLEELRKRMPGDGTVRAVVIGGLVLLFLIVLVDAFGARERAVAARANPPVEETQTATVPSVYRVPRDLASEAATARAQALASDTDEAPIEAEIAEDAIETDVAEAEATEDAVEAEMAEAEVTEDAVEADVAEAEATEDAVEADVAEAEATEDAAEADVAEAEATQEAVEAEAVEAEATEDAAQDVAAGDADALALLAGADIANGESVWRQCRACHVHDAEQNRGGPHLVNIIGREVGAAEGWRYSRSLSEHGGVWTVESLLAWLENPDSYIPGNQMAFRGLRNEQDRIDVLGFLNASSAN
jgi:cytochrome c2